MSNRKIDETRKEALIALLGANQSMDYAAECVAEIHRDRLDPIHSDGGVSISNIRRIYYIRGRRAKRLNQSIYGFDRLLRNLEKTDKKYVNIHSVDGDQYQFLIFTDVKINVLFGIISIHEFTKFGGGERRWNSDYHQPGTKDGKV